MFSFLRLVRVDSLTSSFSSAILFSNKFNSSRHSRVGTSSKDTIRLDLTSRILSLGSLQRPLRLVILFLAMIGMTGPSSSYSGWGMFPRYSSYRLGMLPRPVRSVRRLFCSCRTWRLGASVKSAQVLILFCCKFTLMRRT